MLPFEAPTIFEQLPRFLFKMPRVHQDQKSKYESDELFRRLSRESEVRHLVTSHLSAAVLISHLILVPFRFVTHRSGTLVSGTDRCRSGSSGLRTPVPRDTRIWSVSCFTHSSLSGRPVRDRGWAGMRVSECG